VEATEPQRTRETRSSYRRVVEELRLLQERYGSYPRGWEWTEYPEGEVVFEGKPEVPILVFTKDDTIVDTTGQRTYVYTISPRLVSLKLVFRDYMILRLLVNDRIVEIGSGNPVEGLAYLFFPSVLREFDKQRTIIRGDEGFREFIETVVFDGLELSRDPRTSLVSGELSSWKAESYYVLGEYPGLGFRYIGLGIYESLHLDLYMGVRDEDLNPVFEVWICDDQAHSKECIPYDIISDLPGFIEALRIIGEAEKHLPLFRKSIEQAFWGIMSWKKLYSTN